jgi:multimeric flavodoxin WrbA
MGNTRHCIETFLYEYGGQLPAIFIEEPIEIEIIDKNDLIVFAYPVYFSNLPKIVEDFIKTNKRISETKKYSSSLQWRFSSETAPDARPGC